MNNMAEANMAFLSSFRGFVVDKRASARVVDLFCGQNSTEGLSQKIVISLRSMNMLLEDSEGKEVMNPYVKKWMDDLRGYDAEDILDQIATEILRRRKHAKFKPVTGEVRNFLSITFLNPFVRPVEAKITFKHLVTLDLLRLGVGGKQYPDQRLTTSYVVESDTFGRDEDKKKVIDLLLSSDARGDEMGVIAIVGMGGNGKTILAKLVYNDLGIWFCVSEELTLHTEDPELLQLTLKRYLEGKRFLLVLDDVWSQKPIHKEFLSQLLHYGTEGSMILVTTRNESDALAMHAKPYNLKPLPKDDGLSFFEKHAFREGSSNADPKIKERGIQIVEKCKGLPLVVIGISNLLLPELDKGPSFSKLSRIELSNCRCTSLPPFGQLPSLIELRIEGFDGVVNVRQEFYGNSCSLMKPFGSLKFLSLKNMSNWENWVHFSVQNEVETFSQLEELYIQNCPKLRGELPVHLPSLAKLEISECQDLEGSLVFLPENDLLSTLKRLTMKDCKKLELPMHRQHSSLEELFLTNCCDSLTSFRLDRFPNLESIIIEGCKNLQSLEQHGGDHLMISSIGIQRCPSLVSFPGGLRSPNLAKFTLDNCKSLSSMPNEMHLPSLHYLEIRDCPEVESFPKGELPFNLKQIVIFDCKKLIANWKGWDLQILHSLEWLEIGGKLDVESFPGELLLPNSLTHLNLYLFESLKSLDKKGFQHLTSLVKLVIYDCPKLKYMPEEGFPASLCFLEIDGCPVLEKELRRKGGKEWRKVARIPNIIIDRRYIQGHGEWPEGYVSPYEVMNVNKLSTDSFQNVEEDHY